MSWTSLGTNATGPASSLASIAATIGSNQVAGTITIAAAEGNSTTITCTFSDSRGNTWQTDGTGPAVARRVFAGSSKPTTLLQTADTVTATFTAAVTDRNIHVYAVAGLDQTTWFTAGKVASTSTTSASPDSTTVAATGANNYAVFGICGYNNAGAAFTAGTDGNANAMTKLNETSNSSAFRLATESTLSLTGFTTYKATGAITNAAWATMVVLYNVAAGGSIVTFQVAIAGTGAMTVATKLTTDLKTTIAGTSGIATATRTTTRIGVSVTGTSQLAPALKRVVRLSVAMAGLSAVTAALSGVGGKNLRIALVGSATLLVLLRNGHEQRDRRRRYLRIHGRIDV